MAATFEVGDKVKVEIDNLPYAGIVLTYDENEDPIMYQVSVLGKGNVLNIAESDLTAL